jgi:outer membrane immunogenic protein
MNKLLTAIAALGLIGTPALAADMPVKAAPPAPAPVYNWTGWYVGGNVGASFGRVKTDINGEPVAVNISSPPTIIPGFAGSGVTEPAGFIGGGQIGYNWQLSPIWVVGFEADFQGALEKDRNGFSNSFSIPIGPPGNVTGSEVTSYQTKIDWFGTVRGRIGYVWGNGDVITYVTGGLAYGKVELQVTSTVSGTAPGLGPIPFSVSHAIAHSEVKAGWTAGFGTEGRLLIPGWTYKIESLYMDFGSDPPVPDACLNCSSFVSGGLITGHAHFTDAILRAGLNYQFH